MNKTLTIKEHTTGKWLIQYEKWAACMCSFTREVIWINQKTRPTEACIQKKIKLSQEAAV